MNSCILELWGDGADCMGKNYPLHIAWPKSPTRQLRSRERWDTLPSPDSSEIMVIEGSSTLKVEE